MPLPSRSPLVPRLPRVRPSPPRLPPLYPARFCRPCPGRSAPPLVCRPQPRPPPPYPARLGRPFPRSFRAFLASARPRPACRRCIRHAFAVPPVRRLPLVWPSPATLAAARCTRHAPRAAWRVRHPCASLGTSSAALCRPICPALLVGSSVPPVPSVPSVPPGAFGAAACRPLRCHCHGIRFGSLAAARDGPVRWSLPTGGPVLQGRRLASAVCRSVREPGAFEVACSGWSAALSSSVSGAPFEVACSGWSAALSWVTFDRLCGWLLRCQVPGLTRPIS
ncbi:hypothetical protein BJY16_007949 [Actinoplanes octamycinicus]|uniref:Uncharacterized protein n=1 Tax=Actinoplanes octamycinicus TaxID=135948 RepID=A0A7W7H5N3_9ACTN|nr:hypothetical protein [Actinoplanes octamycinicus]